MHWQSISEFINMGGNGFYVWGAFIVSVGFIAGEIFWLKYKSRQVINLLQSKKESNNPTTNS